ncbi:WXG100 family type VII secretion target [Paenibacillus polysaccharolyticus]|uniref:WXG100 family type VII secretion target n=1 Tax=Paenibacillus polysaccharolyticus TaxID=582692 RepID=A0A1G5F9R9_9BACL|nr:WXG100 family type VII secretion target [Paenibacillus polysaccharolyticus]SCY35841.1 WXG100 family type VII secretion target [Paenibacillus polysaccharolyticus]
MSIIKVTPEQLLHLSKQIEQGRRQLESIRSDLNARIGFIESQWAGATQERFFFDFQQSRPVLDRALESMVKSSQDLRAIAKRFQQADQEQVSVGAVAGLMAFQQMESNLNHNSDKSEYTMVYNTQFRKMMPTDKDGNVTPETLRAYQRDTGSLDMKSAPDVEPEGEDIMQYQVNELKNGVYPFSGEPVSESRARLLITSLQASNMLMAFTGMYRRGYKVPSSGLRFSKTNPETFEVARSLEKSVELQRLKDSLRYRILGYNHEQKKFSYNETLGISRSEKALNKKFQPSDTEGVDFKDPGGLGNISLKGPFLNARQEPLNVDQQNAVIENLKKHIKHNTAVDVHIVDTLGLNKEVVNGLKEGLKDSKIKLIFLE